MENYMALADFQTLWTDEIKPAIPEIVEDARSFNDVYIGVGSTYSEVMIAANHHDSVRRCALMSVTASANYLWVILPSNYTPVVKMGGIEVPMTAQSNVTVDEVTYKVLKSSNSYTGTFNIALH